MKQPIVGVGVVVPARDEEELLPNALTAAEIQEVRDFGFL